MAMNRNDVGNAVKKRVVRKAKQKVKRKAGFKKITPLR